MAFAMVMDQAVASKVFMFDGVEHIALVLPSFYLQVTWQGNLFVAV